MSSSGQAVVVKTIETKFHVGERTESDFRLHDIAFGFWKTSSLLVNHPHTISSSRDGYINQTCDHPLLFFASFHVQYFRNLKQCPLCVGGVPKT